MSDQIMKMLCDMNTKLDRTLEQTAKNSQDIAWVKRIIAGIGTMAGAAYAHVLHKIGIG